MKKKNTDLYIMFYFYAILVFWDKLFDEIIIWSYVVFSIFIEF